MSGRGRGGRGGRGGYTPPSQSVLMLRRSAEECGMDSRNLRSLQSQQELYPDIHLHSSGRNMNPDEEDDQRRRDPASSSSSSSDPAPATTKVTIVTPKRSVPTVQLIQKSRDLQYRATRSAFYVAPVVRIPDVRRYDKRRRNDAGGDNDEGADVLKTVLSLCPLTTLAEGGGTGRLLPVELTVGYDERGRARKSKRAKTLDKNKILTLEEMEKRLKRLKGVIEDDDDDAEVGNLEEEEEEEEQVEDYGKNYYESEDDEDSGGENEATF